MKSFAIAGILLLSVISCKTPDAELRAVVPPTLTFTGLSAQKIADAAQYEAMSEPAIGIIKAGRAMKFLVDNRNPAAPAVHFINANFKVGGAAPDYAKYHFYFARKALSIPEGLDEFNQVTYFKPTKRYYAGVVHTYLINNALVYGVQFYPQDVIKGRSAVDITKLVSRLIAIPAAKFAFVETGNQQATPDSDFAGSGITHLTLEKILGSVNYLAMNTGEAYGNLRIFPPNQDNIAASDIVVFDELPLDLTVVAGVLTKAFQDTNSHINLKSKERNTPNAILRDVSLTHPDLRQFANKPVHMVIGNDNFKIEASTPQIVAQKLAQRFAKPWVPLSWDKTSEILSYDKMCPDRPEDCLAKTRLYGSKAAMLGFLTNKKVLGSKLQVGSFSNRKPFEYDLVPKGFGIPLQLYRELVEMPENKKLSDALNDFIAKEKSNTLTTAQRLAMSENIRNLFFNAKFPPAALAKIKAKVASDLPGIDKIKIRSSANAEDIEGFDGAGLHDSYSAKPNEVDNPDQSCKREEKEDAITGEIEAKMKPRTISCGIKGVYASLWNKRAIEERSFARVDHATVSMGVSVLPAYDFESPIAANSVVVTRVINSDDVYGYSLSIQKGENLVTNPIAGTYSEVSVAAIGSGTESTTLTVTRFGKPTKKDPPLTKPILTEAQTLKLVDVAKAVEIAYCKAKPGFFSGNCEDIPLEAAKPKSLDMEFKILENGHFVCKQAREFSGR